MSQQKHMAGSGYSHTYAQSIDELPEEKRHWWCDNCGAVFKRNWNEKWPKFCNNCDQRDALLNPCKPTGPEGA